jgi:hypothetical protein
MSKENTQSDYLTALSRREVPLPATLQELIRNTRLGMNASSEQKKKTDEFSPFNTVNS